MEYIKKEELTEGEIYTHINENVVKYKYLNNNNKVCGVHIGKNKTRFISDLSIHTGSFNITELRLATSEEKHWLESCVKLDKFITFEEAMKTFITEYVEWIDNIGSNNLGYQTKDHFKKNKIFKTDIELPSHGFQTQNWIKHLEIYANNYKPSTKEAYDAQFVVIKPLPQFKVIETIETITKVENNEGNQFFIGDNVIGSKSKIKSKIISFKYNIDKTAILAITDKTPNIGIGINHIEHYIEPKVESNNKTAINIAKNSIYGAYPITPKESYLINETLLEKAKRLYPIGTRYRIEPNYFNKIESSSGEFGPNYFNKIESSSGEFGITNNGVFCKNNLGWILYNGTWAEIVN